MSDLGTRAPKPERRRLGSSQPIALKPIAKPDDEGTATAAPVTDVAPAVDSPQAAAPADKTPTTEPTKTPRAARTKPTGTSGATTPTAPAVSTSSAATSSITLRLGEGLHSRLVAYKEAEDLSYPTVVLLAVQNTYSRLPELLRARSVQLETDAGPNLFGLPAQITRRSAAATEAKHQLPIKVSPERRGVLDHIVKETKAPSLNELVCAALDAFLPELV